MLAVRRRRISGLVAVAACAALSGCGDRSDAGAARATPDASRSSPASAFDASTLLVKKNEEPGFEPAASPQTETQPFPMAPEGTKRLQQSGFVSSTFAPLQSKDAAGASSITLFKTASGAKAWKNYETTTAGIKQQIPHPGRIRRFSVKGVPGSRGWTGLDLHGNRIGQVYWADGRCEFVLGNEGNPPFVDDLTAGAKAWYARTKGTCRS